MSEASHINVSWKGLAKIMVVQEEHEPITANESELPALNKIGGVLQNTNAVPKLVGSDGEAIELPPSVFDALRQLVPHMILGNAIFIIPENKELCLQEAADILNIAKESLIRVLDEGKIPFITLGRQRYIRFGDVMSYKKQRDAGRRQAIEEIARISQEAGMYD
jgi:excisionase family DNA binding protein